MKFIRRNYIHISVITVLLVSAVMTVFRYKASVYRLIYAFRDLGISIAYYFMQLFDKELPVTVTELPSGDVLQYLPFDVNEILRKLSDMWAFVFNSDCFLGYLAQVLQVIELISMVLLPVMLLAIFVPMIFKRILFSPNDDRHGEKSRSVHFVENKVLPLTYTVKGEFSKLFACLLGKPWYRWIFIILWLVNFNVLTVVAEFLAYYFYFAFSFDFGNLLSIQFVKLLLDVIIMLSGAPVVFWLVVTYVIICKVRRNIGYQRLEHRENLDRAVISKQPLILMFTGTMGTGKTTENTSFCLSIEIMFREKAFELMMEIESKYPNFPWINLEDDLCAAIDLGLVKNLTQCRRFVDFRRKRFENTLAPGDIFDYNVDVYRYSYDDNLTDREIWSSISEYAQLYFIYIIQSSLLVTNYGIRVDNVLESEGNFPLWNTDLFRRSPGESAACSRRSHILDYDILRLGKRIIEDNPLRNTFEFGILSMSEFAKERGNQKTLEGVKKKDDETNQKNDKFIDSLKMARHKATICGFPFVFFLADEQRDQSLNADTRELMNVINIISKDPAELLMPMFFVEDLLHECIYPRFVNFFTQYRYYRGDMCLVMYIVSNLVFGLHNQYKRIYNLYSCNVLNVSIKSGKEGSEAQAERLHILHKKVYSDRFGTDCYRGFSEPALEEADLGLDDYREYEGTVATLEELHYQNSYFIRDLEGLNFEKKEEEKNEN